MPSVTVRVGDTVAEVTEGRRVFGKGRMAGRKSPRRRSALVAISVGARAAVLEGLLVAAVMSSILTWRKLF